MMNIKHELQQVFLPYCIKPLGNNRFVILNRDYKPVGYPKGSWLPEAEYQALLEKSVFSIPNSQSLYRFHNGTPRSDGMIYLHDGSLRKNNESAYWKRLYDLTGIVSETQVKPHKQIKPLNERGYSDS